MSKKKKTYKKKYTTKDRLDMSKGGRVGYQKGKKVAIDPRTGKALPRKSIERPIAVGGPARPNPNLGGPRRGASPTLPERKLNQVGNPLPELSQAEKDRRQKLAQARIDANKKLMEQNPFKPVIQNLDNQRIDSPKPTQPMPKDRVPPKQPPMSVGGVGGGRRMTGREELELANQSVSGNQIIPNVSTGNQQTATTPEKPIPREDAIKYYKKAMENNPLGKVTGVPDVIPYGRTGFERDNNKRPPDEITSVERIPNEADLERERLAEERRRAAEEAARKAAEEAARKPLTPREMAEASARGELPEGAIIPQAEQVGYERDAQGQLLLDDQGNPIPLREQQITTMDPVTGARTDIRAEGQAPEQVTTVGEAATAQTPEQIRTETITDDELTLVPEEAQVDFATGEVSDKAIAEAAQVDRVEPIEGAEVEIPEGALTERVVGTISEGAKATAVMNVGTSLSRITRAKKQLSRAGLSDADIEEIGNDPEALEARLADFSEEQRGIIEGLPQEALVSTQMNNLLEGIESGEIPTWARPAVAQVEAMLARRGMSASTVGRDSLFNAIIQSAMPMAQSNAQAIQQSVSQQKTIEAQAAEANAQRMQQTALTNAQNVFNMDMAQFSADQQTALSNSKFMQTVGLTEATNEQQATIQNAVLMSQANLAEADFYQKSQIQNAQAFLQMDVQNLANEQQANVLKAQQTQQRMLSNQSAQNAAAQFNAASENQTQQFMASLNAQIDQYNTSQMNAMAQFDTTQKNAAEARDAQRAADVEKFNTQLETQIDQFNANQDFARNQWNAQNKAVVEQSNTQWRRNLNTANTAMQNQINAQNAQNSFDMSRTAQSFLWQELRDQADYDFRNSENEKNRIAQLVNTALASDPSKYGGSVSSIEKLIGAITGDLF